jgi:N-acetylneuraminic acid mutarotase
LHTLAFSPDSQRLLTAGTTPGEILKVWDVATGRDVVTLSAEPGYYSSIRFSPDGNILFAYDPIADQWTRKAQIPGELEAVQSMGGTVDGLIYLFGGISTGPFCAHTLSLAYDPAQDQFTSRQELPVPTTVAVSATIAGKVYLAGGVNEAPGSPTFEVYNSLWVFDPQDQKPWLDIVISKVKVTQHTVIGTKYLLESSTDLKSWSAIGTSFTAQSETATQEFDVDVVGHYFRIREVE